jgi:hypothetical protein
MFEMMVFFMGKINFILASALYMSSTLWIYQVTFAVYGRLAVLSFFHLLCLHCYSFMRIFNMEEALCFMRMETSILATGTMIK